MAIPQSVDAYIASSPPEVQPILKAIRLTVRKAAPTAEERISYRMPAYFLGGVLVYFAAFKKHIGFYPPVYDKSLKPLIARYVGPKGNLQFLSPSRTRSLPRSSRLASRNEAAPRGSRPSRKSRGNALPPAPEV